MSYDSWRNSIELQRVLTKDHLYCLRLEMVRMLLQVRHNERIRQRIFPLKRDETFPQRFVKRMAP
jgi:hypothetical protein